MPLSVKQVSIRTPVVRIHPSAPMKMQEEIMTFLSNEPLIKAEITRAFLDWPSLLNSEGKTLFFGVGLCTAKQPAVAVPFDILSFFFVAERLKRFFALSEVIVFIADAHAQTNRFMTPEIISDSRRNILETFNRIIHNFSFPNFEILLASEITQLESFQSILSTLPSLENQYLRQELADVVWLTQNKNLSIKLGWTIDNSTQPTGHDERFFDTQLLSIQKIPVSFMFTRAGRTFDPNKPKASPYISVRDDHRLLIKPQEDVPQKFHEAETRWGVSSCNGVRGHFADIVRLFEKLFIKLPLMTLEQKIQFILNIATQ